MKYIRTCLFLFLCLKCSSILAQTDSQIEADLLTSFKKIDYWASHHDADMKWVNNLDKANEAFVAKLNSYARNNPATITYPFSSLVKNRLDVSISADSMLKIYSWDTQTGGTMHWFESVFQYRVGKKTLTYVDTPKTEGDVRSNYHKIYTLKTAGKTYYLAIWLAIGSTKDAAEGVDVFTIENNKLTQAKVIKTKSGMHNSLGYSYNFFSVVDIPYSKRPSIRFDTLAKTIDMPLVDNKDSVTHQLITYKFNGQYFEKIK